MTTREFFKHWLALTLGLGGVLAGYNAITLGWGGVLLGLGLALIFALVWVLLERRAYTRPTRPLSYEALLLPVINTRFEFPVREVDTWVSLGAVLIVTVSNTTWSEPLSRLQLLYMGCLLAAAVLLRLVEGKHTRLHILPTGMEVQALFYTLTIPWSAVERIEQRKYRWILSYQSCEMKASPLVTAWLKFKGFDRRLFLNKFALDYPKSNLARAIYQRGEAKIKHFTTEKG